MLPTSLNIVKILVSCHTGCHLMLHPIDGLTGFWTALLANMSSSAARRSSPGGINLLEALPTGSSMHKHMKATEGSILTT
jgi:hypothetical protein